jgi:hypothetical protein
MLGVGLTSEQRQKCPPRHVVRSAASALLLHRREYASGRAKRLAKKVARCFKYVRPRRIVCGQVAPARRRSPRRQVAVYSFQGPQSDVDSNNANEGEEPGRGVHLTSVRADPSRGAARTAAAIAAAGGFGRTSVATPSTATSAAARPAAGAATRSTASAGLPVATSALSAAAVSTASVSTAPVSVETPADRSWLRGAQWPVLP